MKIKKEHNGAELLVECLRVQGVKYIFGVPGASLMPILDVLFEKKDDPEYPQFILCRHEQNAAFMAQCMGRLTGIPGVCLATAGPGATNLVTGVATATADRDPMIALTGENPHGTHFKRNHQNLSTARLFRSIAKMSNEVNNVDVIPEVVSMAFAKALASRPGGVHLSFPADVLRETTRRVPLSPVVSASWSVAPPACIDHAAKILISAHYPIVLLGVGATQSAVVSSVRRLLSALKIPVVGTFEAAGVVSRKEVHQFIGRVGLKTIEPGDIALESADAILTIGYDTIEYSPSLWNKKRKTAIIHIDDIPADSDEHYQPVIQLLGGMAENIDALTARVGKTYSMHPDARAAQKVLMRDQKRGEKLHGSPIHPLKFISDLRKTIGDNVTVVSDVGSHQLWLAKYFFCYEPRHLLFSMGFQTIGVALPWAMATTLARPGKPVISISGDGSFLISATELETAVRLKMKIIHCVWRDGSYNLVKIQQQQAYKRAWGVQFGNPDIVAFAESFGAKGYRIRKASDIIPVLKKAFLAKGPVVIDVPIDYSSNLSLLGSSELAHSF